jgi:sugar lactone lactonase YvrE
MTDVTCAFEIRSIIGESPIWNPAERRLYWLDLRRPAVYRFDPASGRNETLPARLRDYVGGLVMRAKGGCVIDKDDGIFAYDPASGEIEPLVHPEAGRADTWFNDAKCDRAGNLWAGTGDRGEAAPLGSLYRFKPDLSWQRIDTGIICSNGPAFGPDGRVAYFTDSYARQIYAYDITPETGHVGPRRVFAEVPEANVYPDGMTVDAEGYLWNAQWDGWRVVRYAPDGRLDRTIKLPVPRPASVAFGGDDLSTLYVTTASFGMSEAEIKAAPLSGSLFALKPGVRGLPEPAFAG